MFHVRICTDQGVLNFIAEVNPYNLRTLRQHVRQGLRDDGPLRLSVQLEPADQSAFTRYTAGWLPQLIRAGTPVEVAVRQPTQTPRHGLTSATQPRGVGSTDCTDRTDS